MGAQWSECVSRLLHTLRSQSEQFEGSDFAFLFLCRPLKEFLQIVDAASCEYTFSFFVRALCREGVKTNPQRVDSRSFETQIRKGQNF